MLKGMWCTYLIKEKSSPFVEDQHQVSDLGSRWEGIYFLQTILHWNLSVCTKQLMVIWNFSLKFCWETCMHVVAKFCVAKFSWQSLDCFHQIILVRPNEMCDCQIRWDPVVIATHHPGFFNYTKCPLVHAHKSAEVSCEQQQKNSLVITRKSCWTSKMFKSWNVLFSFLPTFLWAGQLNILPWWKETDIDWLLNMLSSLPKQLLQ